MEDLLNLKIKTANLHHVKAIHNVMKTVGETIEDKESYYVDNEDFIKLHISKEGFILIALHNNLVVGFLIVRTPGDSEDNLGIDIKAPPNELQNVAHIESTAVLQEYRGNGLQIKLIEEAEKILSAKGFTRFMSTVYPGNSRSLVNFYKLGYEVIKTKIKYGGVKRHILLKNNFE